MKRNRHAAIGLASATLALCLVLGGTRPSAAAGKQLTIDPPGHGTFSQPFTANYTLGHQCSPGATVAFQWDAGGPLLGQAPVGDFARCAVSGVPLAPPLAHPELLAPGPHTILAAVVQSGGVLRGSDATAVYVLDPAEGGPGGPTPISVTTQLPDASTTPLPTPTPAPTAVPTATPPQPITATFPPYNCENGVPDGPTPCPSAASGVLAVNATPPPLSGTVATSGTSGPPAALVLGLAFAMLVGVLVATVAWILGGRRRAA